VNEYKLALLDAELRLLESTLAHFCSPALILQ